MSRISDFIDQAKKELLDLSGRNKLLSFHFSKATGIELKNSAQDILNKISEKQCEIIPVPEDGELDQKIPKSQINLLNSNEEKEEDSLDYILSNEKDVNKKLALIEENFIGDDLEKIKSLEDALFWLTKIENEKEEKAKELKEKIYENLSEKEKENFLKVLEKVQKKLSKNKNYILETDYEFKALERRVKKTGGQARSYIEEKGVNVLYLALGFLNWCDDRDKEKIFKAPLILTPVKLKVSEDKKKFFLQPFDEQDLDLHENVTLKMRLDQDFNVKMPDLIENDIEKYYEDVTKAINKQLNWSVAPDYNVVGFFDFTKYVMYEDLKESNWINEDNSEWPELLHVLLDPKIQFKDGGNLDLEEHARIEDHIEADEPTAVMDADSSQVKAILDVRAGKHLVIQGPPGTGKSQTITNIIADAFRSDKKILFVSEKMAALEVVKKRLEKVNLGDAAVELHSNKTNKKEFYEDLEKVLKLGQPQKPNFEVSGSELQNSVDSLHAYADAVNKRLDSGLTPYRIFGLYDEAKNELAELNPSTEIVRYLQDYQNEMVKINVDDFFSAYSVLENIYKYLEKNGQPKKHPFYGSNIKNLLSSDKKLLKEILQKISNKLERYLQLKQSINNSTKTDLNFKELKQLIDAYIISPDLEGFSLDVNDWQNKDEIETTFKLVEEIQSKKEKHKDLVTNAWDEDLLEYRGVLNTRGRKLKITQWLDKELKSAVIEVQKIFKDKPIKNPLELVKLIDVIEEVKKNENELKTHEDTAKKLFGSSWNGSKTEVKELKEKSDFVLNNINDENATTHELFYLYKLKLDKDSLKQDMNNLSDEVNSIDDLINEMDKFLNLQDKFNLKEGNFSDEELFAKINNIESGLDRAEEWITYIKLRQGLNDVKIGWMVKVIEEWNDDFKFIQPFFQYQVMEAKAKSFMNDFKEINDFEIIQHNKLVERFKELDQNLKIQRQFEMLTKHYDSIRSARSTIHGQISNIMREINKKARKLPIRKIMQISGDAIQNIKPIFMMSPLSLASFIPPKSVHFDLVIFDEASQVRSVDALGAALRADQLVVVGDSKQMPPTSFFDAQMSDDVEDEDKYYEQQMDTSATKDMESILKLMESQNAPQRMLQWHYRSQYASLIDASNYLYYDSRLVTYPAADEEGNGLIFNYVKNGIYDRGGKRSNHNEAKQVAEAVLKHAKNNPELTLGVVGLSSAQRDELENQIELLSLEYPELSRFIESHGPDETMFVKNLETVQGDERDVIFISIGYGKTKEGYFANSFGPINIEGGERRLNVLISRARKRCEVFSSIRADEIKDSKSRGAQDLKVFLKYAETRILDRVEETNEGYDSEFERQVQLAVQKYGYTVDTQVGSAGFKIDLAVRDKKNPNRYILAIECDGAAYHRSFSARDRDRLRQEVLENRGWTFHRIWSTAWFRDSEVEIKKIIEAIEKAETTKDLKKKKLNEVDVKINRNESLEIDFDISKYKKPKWVKKYQRYDIVWTKKKEDFYEYSGYGQLKREIKNFVDIESPVNFDYLKRRISKGIGFASAGTGIERRLKEVLTSMNKNKDVIFKNDQIRSYDEELYVRDRSKQPEPERDFEFIPEVEIQEAAKLRIDGMIGGNWEDTIPDIAKDFGYARCTKEMSKYFTKAIKKII